MVHFLNAYVLIRELHEKIDLSFFFKVVKIQDFELTVALGQKNNFTIRAIDSRLNHFLLDSIFMLSRSVQ